MRLTREDIFDNGTRLGLSCTKYIKQIEKELMEYKQIEEELGIDLITLFKALKQDNVWVKEHNTKEQEIVCERVRLNFLHGTLDFVEPRKEIGKGRNLFDYGKTWALTREELLLKPLTQEEHELLKEVLK